ncbi:MAG: hypothetical protein ACOC4L_00170 [Halanaerobium sp.]
MNNLKRMCILVVFIVGILVFSFQPVRADFSEVYDITELEFTGGFSYNFYNMKEFSEWVDEDYYTDEKIDGGIGIHLGVERELEFLDNDLLKNVRAGLEVEWLPVSYSEFDVSLSQTGFLFNTGYELEEVHRAVPEGVYINTGLGLSRYRVRDHEVDYGSIDEVYYGTVAKTGIEAKYSLMENANIGGYLNYRYSRSFTEKYINFSGAEIGFKAGYSF